MSKDYPCVHYDDGKCKEFSDDKVTSYCVLGPCGAQVLSKADRIRAMSDEELAQAIYQGISSDACDYCKENNAHCTGHACQGKADAEVILEWLQQPAEEVRSDG